MNFVKLDCDDLRCGIIYQAAYDYLEWRKKLHKIDEYGRVYRFITREELVRNLEEVNRFFNSEWYRQLCDIDAQYITDQLDKEFEEWKSKYARKKKKAG